jgi:hypothetical protein
MSTIKSIRTILESLWKIYRKEGKALDNWIDLSSGVIDLSDCILSGLADLTVEIISFIYEKKSGNKLA